jgi:hypothetical protein
MTFAETSASHKDTIGPGLQRLQDIMRRDRTGTHDSNDPDRRRILHSTDPSQVSGSVSSPGAQKSNDLRLKILRHRLLHMDICKNRLSSAMSRRDLIELKFEARNPKYETISKS